MNQGRGDNFTPRGRGRGRGGFRANASLHSPADHRSHYNVGAEPSSSDYRFCSGNQVSWQRKTVSNQAQPVASDISWPRNQNSKKHGQWKDITDWKGVSPTSYKATLNCYNNDSGIAKSIKGSADRPLNLESLKSSSSVECAVHDTLSCSKDPESVGGSETSKCDSSQNSELAELFDVCPQKGGGSTLIPFMIETFKEKRNRSLAPKARLLRNGMVLLKNYISISEQVEVVNECRRLGLGTGGFYHPCNRNGGKLSRRMMCLGKNWDPETCSYGETRRIDGAKPPPIPSSFLDLVTRSIKESHTLIAEECRSTERAQAILPSVTPDTCLVNFYTTNGRLSLHQDRGESKASIDKGLPVVSISIGDSAEFLYGDQREVEKAQKVTLESGDVLIFGGQSRLIFHGVSSIKPDTAPKSLLHMTNLRTGRLNLTFREY